MAGFEIVKVVREHVPVEKGNSGTFGTVLDGLLHDTAARGEEVQEITLRVSQEEWGAFCARSFGDEARVVGTKRANKGLGL